MSGITKDHKYFQRPIFVACGEGYFDETGIHMRTCFRCGKANPNAKAQCFWCGYDAALPLNKQHEALSEKG